MNGVRVVMMRGMLTTAIAVAAKEKTAVKPLVIGKTPHSTPQTSPTICLAQWQAASYRVAGGGAGSVSSDGSVSVSSPASSQ